ncbi:siphovirus ReqiPepy6 Gp37-like family protein [Ruminococcaceae bacterium OttesenSCG-928-I18]|nr:siphovirus ReqiPepy6 Gp37-like family protein [Ruminococcaceae bacterium OttesenSCG-928-I18]
MNDYTAQRNKPIRVYSPQLLFQGIIEDHDSLLWKRRYYEPGEFELKAPITDHNRNLLRPGNILTLRNAGEAMFIEDLENEDTSNAKQLVRAGRALSAYFDFRRIGTPLNPTAYFSGPVEDAMHFLINFCAPLPLVELGNVQGFPEVVEFQATMKNLSSYLTKLSRASGIGYRLRPDFKQKKLFFETYKGVDRTLSQGVNSRVIFSEAYENLNEVRYRYNDQLFATEVVVGGEGEGTDRVYVTIGGGSGLQLRQGFCDAKDLRSDNLSPAQYRANLRQRGLEWMAGHCINESLEFKTDPTVNFNYREHYDLGDLVTAEKREWEQQVDQRLTELQETYEHGGMSVDPTMGDPLPESIDWRDE